MSNKEFMPVEEPMMSWAHQKAIAWIVMGIFGLLRNPAAPLQIKPLKPILVILRTRTDDTPTTSAKDVSRINSGFDDALTVNVCGGRSDQPYPRGELRCGTGCWEIDKRNMIGWVMSQFRLGRCNMLAV